MPPNRQAARMAQAGRIAAEAYAYARVPPLSLAVMWVTVSPVSTKIRVTSTDV